MQEALARVARDERVLMRVPLMDLGEKRSVTLYDYTIDRQAGAGSEGAPIIPITGFTAHRLEVPAGAEPLYLAAEHFVESVHTGTEPLTSGARSLRVVEALEAADRAATNGGTAG